MQKVVVAMSGGVDSSVAAALLVEQGYDVVGITMNVWSSPENQTKSKKSCCGTEDMNDARRVADKLRIPYYVSNMRDVFSKMVIENFVNEYAAGRTPNPCLRCNVHMKFGKLLQKALSLNADFVATGHYAILEKIGDRFCLRKAKDATKDQSYTLAGLSQQQLSRALFPLGNMTKTEVREKAKELDLITANKAESQDICFLNTKYQNFIKEVRPDIIKKGDILDPAGKVVGSHDGSSLYTIGQRHGLNISSNEKQYVFGLNSEKNEIKIGSKNNLLCDSMTVNNLNWVSIEKSNIIAYCQYSAHGSLKEAKITTQNLDELIVEFNVKQTRAAAGQTLVGYDTEGRVLFSGLIAECH